MPVRKFRDMQSMKAPRWYEAGSPELTAAMAAIWDVALRTSKRHYPPGVYKHHTIEEMQEVQAAWIINRSAS